MASSSSSFAPVRLEDREFEMLRRLIHAETGISLAPSKRVLLESRLARRLRALEMDSFASYCQHLTTRLDEELVPLINCVTTNKTEFFREAHHFEFLRNHVLPAAEARAERTGKRRLRIWSAGCSTGEEPYSLALTLLEWLEGRPGWDVRILASDIDTNVLDAASRGCYPDERLEDVPTLWRRRWFREMPQRPGWMQADDALRALIAFRRINLNEEPWAIRTTFDVILCRNVIIYFNRATQTSLLGRFARLLDPDGHLIIGHSESLAWLCETFSAVRGQPTVYRLASAARRDRDRDAASTSVASPSPASPLVASRSVVAVAVAVPKADLPKVDSSNVSEAAPAPTRVEAHAPVNAPVRELAAGEMRASSTPEIMHTVLASGLAVALFDAETRLGGMHHLLLADLPVADAAVEQAMTPLLDAVLHAGGVRERVRVKLFGGANDVAVARAFFDRESIPVVAERISGDAPIELLFHVDSGRARVRELPVPERAGAAIDREGSLKVQDDAILVVDGTSAEA